MTIAGQLAARLERSPWWIWALGCAGLLSLMALLCGLIRKPSARRSEPRYLPLSRTDPDEDEEGMSSRGSEAAPRLNGRPAPPLQLRPEVRDRREQGQDLLGSFTDHTANRVLFDSRSFEAPQCARKFLGPEHLRSRQHLPVDPSGLVEGDVGTATTAPSFSSGSALSAQRRAQMPRPRMGNR